MTCSKDKIELNSGYSLFLEDITNVSDVWHAFRCPTLDACPTHSLLTQESETRGSATNCTQGHTGHLCANCVTGWKRGPTGMCQRCTVSSRALNPLLLIPVAIVLTYVSLRVILTFRRTKRLRKAEAAAELFEDMDSDDTGILTVTELHAGLASLGMQLNEVGVKTLMGTVVADVYGQITKDEFVACKFL